MDHCIMDYHGIYSPSWLGGQIEGVYTHIWHKLIRQRKNIIFNKKDWQERSFPMVNFPISRGKKQCSRRQHPEIPLGVCSWYLPWEIDQRERKTSAFFLTASGGCWGSPRRIWQASVHNDTAGSTGPDCEFSSTWIRSTGKNRANTAASAHHRDTSHLDLPSKGHRPPSWDFLKGPKKSSGNSGQSILG